MLFVCCLFGICGFQEVGFADSGFRDLGISMFLDLRFGQWYHFCCVHYNVCWIWDCWTFGFGNLSIL